MTYPAIKTFTLPVPANNLHVNLLMPLQANRDAARSQVHLNLPTMLGEILHIPPAQITLQHPRGQPISVQLPVALQCHPPGVSISYEQNLALVALYLNGAVGADIVCLPQQPIAENPAHWWQMANDYLPPDSCQAWQQQHGTRLNDWSTPQFADWLAQQWATHEAKLKCRGIALQEWTAPLHAQLQRLDCFALTLPTDILPANPAASWAAAVAIDKVDFLKAISR